MKDAQRASTLLIDAVAAAGREDWPAVTEHLNAHPGLTPCTVMIVLARIVIVATAPPLGDGEVAIATAYVDTDEGGDITPETEDDLNVIAAVISAVCNDDEAGAHEAIHHMSLDQASRVVMRMLITTHGLVDTNEDRHADN